MKSIDLRHRLAAVLLAMCLVVCCALPAFATSANIVPVSYTHLTLPTNSLV